jgi:DNA polymerase III epsilon subunit-like protein
MNNDTVIQINTIPIELQKFNRKVEKYKNKLSTIKKTSIEYNETATKFLKYKSKFFADKNNRDIYENYTNKKLDNYIIKYNHIVFDIETNASSDILQIAYEIYNEEFKLINKKNIYINDGIHFTDYYKKINRDLIVKKGITPDEALEIIIKDFNNSKILVGHNIIGFDIQKINQYITKHNLHYKIKDDIIYHDTMLNTNNIVKSKNINGKEKTWCKLSELYKHLFPNNQTEEDDLHDATYDVFLTSQCYEKLVKEHNFFF